MEPKRITVEELKRRMDSGERMAILDKREEFTSPACIEICKSLSPFQSTVSVFPR